MRMLLDYEGGSPVRLGDVGQWRWAADPATRLWCVGYTVRHIGGGAWAPPRVAVLDPGRDGLAAVKAKCDEFGVVLTTRQDFIDTVNASVQFVAHNVGMERAATVCKIPEVNIPVRAWSCTMARASVMGLPPSLEGLSALLGGPQKDGAGHKVMMQMARPRKARKDEDPTRLHWFDDAHRMALNYLYCQRDISAETYADDVLPELVPAEFERWQMIMDENARGIRVDMNLVERMQRMADEDYARAVEEAQAATGFAINLKSPKQLHEYLAQFGIKIADEDGKDTLRAAALERFLLENSHMLPESARVLLTGRLETVKSSIAKLSALRARVMADGRVRDLQVYHGAHTGRTTGSGPQPLNQPRPGDVEVTLARPCILAGDHMATRLAVAPHAKTRVLGTAAGVRNAKAPRSEVSVSEAVASCLRTVYVPSPGKVFLVGDFAQVETCALMDVAGEKEIVEKIKKYNSKELKGDLYCDFGEQIYGYPVDKKKNPAERQMGKQGVLSLGYNSGDETFVGMCAQYQMIIDVPFAADVIRKYKRWVPGVPQTWRDFQEAATRAVQNPGRYYETRGFVYSCDTAGNLKCRMPNGNHIYYPQSFVRPGRYGMDLFGHAWKNKGWRLTHLYGGHLTENNIQKVCREIMVDAELVLHNDPRFDTLFSCYDEIVTEVDENRVDECLGFMRELMCTAPSYMPNMPLHCEPTVMTFYQKD